MIIPKEVTARFLHWPARTQIPRYGRNDKAGLADGLYAAAGIFKNGITK